MGLCVLTGWCGRTIPFREQLVGYDALRQTAAIILGILGVWIAMAHPQTGSKEISWQDHRVRVRRLVSAILICTGIVGSTLLVGIAAPAVERLEALIPHANLLRGVSFGVLVFAAIFLIWSLLASLTDLDEIVNQSSAHAIHQQSVKSLLPVNHPPSSTA